eukprot:3300353-Amphidinium_carterae.1
MQHNNAAANKFLFAVVKMLACQDALAGDDLDRAYVGCARRECLHCRLKKHCPNGTGAFPWRTGGRVEAVGAVFHMHDGRTMQLWSKAWFVCFCWLSGHYSVEADPLERKHHSAQPLNVDRERHAEVGHHGDVDTDADSTARSRDLPRHKRARAHQRIAADTLALKEHRTEVPSHTEIEV